MKLIILLVGAILGGVLNRMGGTSLGTKWRDLGVSALSCLVLVLTGVVHTPIQYLSLLPCALLMYGALTTYRYFLPKPKDYKFYHYSLHGFMVSFAIFPLMFFTGSWLWFGVRCITCATLVGLVSHLIDKDWLEEFLRGFILVASLGLFLI